MSATPLEFWFDFASTYSYVAAMRIEDLCRSAGVPLAWRPFLLGPIFARQGWDDSHFNIYPARGAYMWRDLERLTTKFGLPWRRPSVFPRITTLAARVACAVAGEPWAGAFIRRCFVANFGEDRAVGEETVVRDVIRELGRDDDSVLAVAVDGAHRRLLRANTERAIERGIFGAPDCIVGGELFWGEETLEDAIAWALGQR